MKLVKNRQFMHKEGLDIFKSFPIEGQLIDK